MATLRNTNPISPVFLPLIGRVLEAGETFDVPDEQAANLLAQLGNYELVKGKVTPLPPPDTAPEVEPDPAPEAPVSAPVDAAPSSDDTANSANPQEA